MKSLFAFGPFRLDPSRRRLVREGQPIPLPPKAFDVLLVLVENRGRVVGKEHLLRAVWPDVAVEEGNLTQHVFTIRKMLGENGDGSQYVATIPRRGYQFVADVLELPWPGAPTAAESRPAEAAATRPKSMAVLPFAPLALDDDDRLLGLGMADALIMRLGNIRQAVVRPTSAVRRYVGSEPMDPVAAGRDLQVDLVLEGSLQRSGDRIRVTAQLVCANKGTSLWGARFDETLTDIFAVQDSIAERLACALVPQLTETERRRLTTHDTNDVEAHQACLRGRHYLARRTVQGLQKAIEEFDHAIARDPGYALAHAGIAQCCTIMSSAGYEPRTRAVRDRARSTALKAVALDSELADAHVALGLVHFRLDWRWLDAEREFTRAIDLNPGLASAHHFLALHLAAMGRDDEALAAINRAKEIDPLSSIINAAAGRIRHFARAYDEAIAHYRATLELDPDFADAHMNLGLTYVEIGRHREAIAEFQHAAELSGRRMLMCAVLGYAYAVNGQEDEAQRMLDELTPLAGRGELSSILLTYPHIGLGHTDLAFEWLERAAEERAGLLIYLKVEPMFDRLRGDPRFARLMRRLQLAY